MCILYFNTVFVIYICLKQENHINCSYMLLQLVCANICAYIVPEMQCSGVTVVKPGVVDLIYRGSPQTLRTIYHHRLHQSILSILLV